MRAVYLSAFVVTVYGNVKKMSYEKEKIYFFFFLLISVTKPSHRD